MDSNGGTLFANNLGGYTKTGEIMGCAFNTWDNYFMVNNGVDRLKCRLILSEVPGDPVRVEIINHAAFSGSRYYMTVWIAKVFNPTVAVTSVPISIKIDHITVSNNNILPIYYDTFDVFMNSQTPSPTGNYTYGCQDSSTLFFNGAINTINYVRLYP